MNRRDGSMQYVIDAVIMPCLLYHGNVGGLFHYTDQPLVSGRARTIGAWINVSDVVANGAQAQAGLDVVYSEGEGTRVIFARSQDVKGEPLRGLASDAGKFF